jgi:hypothetical protein
MFWTILFLILISLVKVLPTVLPLGAVEWIMSKFEAHSKIGGPDLTIIIDGNELLGQEKELFIQFFNEAIFMEKYYIYPGTEQSFLPPQKKGIPITINTKWGKSDMRLYLFKENSSIDVVKQYKKKIVAYNIHSEKLQEYFVSTPEKAV